MELVALVSLHEGDRRMAKRAPAGDEASSVRISKSLKKRLKIYAAKNEEEMRRVVDTAIEEYLKKRSA